jgi:hypothetical protein
VREPLESVHDLSSRGQLSSTGNAMLDMRMQRREAESGLAVQKLIDFVW